MQRAIDEARKNLKTLDGGPFGACIVKNGRLISAARNTVLSQHDASAHAEINALRLASKKMGSYDLSGCVIYSTTEPCPMCFCAIHWARIKEIYYGTKTADAKKIGFNELNIPDAKLASMGKIRVKLVAGVLLDECWGLFNDWYALPKKEWY